MTRIVVLEKLGEPGRTRRYPLPDDAKPPQPYYVLSGETWISVAVLESEDVPVGRSEPLVPSEQ